MGFVAYRPQAGVEPPLIVVDLGFSSNDATCGLKAPEQDARNRSFGPMTKDVRKLLSEHPTAVLVLEAPLSAKYKKNGNPIRRGDFEGGHHGQDPKYWYYNAGAQMALAAQRLLSALQDEPQLRERDIRLAEAFLTRAVLPDADHKHVAEKIYAHFHEVAPHWVDGGVPLHPAVPEAPGVWVFTAAVLGNAG